MNIFEYINDPKLAPQTNRETKQDYLAKLNDIIIRENKVPVCIPYIGNDEYWFYFQVPDAKLKNIKYDVVLQFTPKNDEQRQSRSIGDYDVKFFSNDPGFTFYFCWVFNKENLLIEQLRTKCNTIALTQPPDKTNPERRIRMCKSFYFAYLILEKYNWFNKDYINMSHPEKLNITTLLGKIKTDNNVRAKIDKTQKVKRFEKKVIKKVSSISSDIEKKADDIVSTAKAAFTKTTGTTNSKSSSKTTRTVGKTKTQKTVGKIRRRH